MFPQILGQAEFLRNKIKTRKETLYLIMHEATKAKVYPAYSACCKHDNRPKEELNQEFYNITKCDKHQYKTLLMNLMFRFLFPLKNEIEWIKSET